MGFTYPAVAGAMQNDQRAFSAALASLQGTASNFAAHCIQDSRVRQQYLRDILKMSAEFVQAVVATGVCAATAPVCIGVAALVGGILASIGTDLRFGTVYVSPQGRN